MFQTLYSCLVPPTATPMDRSQMNESDIFVIAPILARRAARYARRVMNFCGSRTISVRKPQMGLDLEKLQEIARERQSICKGRTSGQRLINIARPWLRFLGWWHVPAIELRFPKVTRSVRRMDA